MNTIIKTIAFLGLMISAVPFSLVCMQEGQCPTKEERLHLIEKNILRLLDELQSKPSFFEMSKEALAKYNIVEILRHVNLALDYIPTLKEQGKLVDIDEEETMQKLIDLKNTIISINPNLGRIATAYKL